MSTQKLALQYLLSLWSFSHCSCFYFSSNTALHVCFFLGKWIIDYSPFTCFPPTSGLCLHYSFCSFPHLLVSKSYRHFIRLDVTCYTYFRSLYPGEMDPKGLWTQKLRMELEEVLNWTELNWNGRLSKSLHPERDNTPYISSLFPSFSPPNSGKELFNSQKENWKSPL